MAPSSDAAVPHAGAVLVCALCGTPGKKLLRCGRCKSVHYHDRECQRRHYARHKAGCRRTGSRPSPDGGANAAMAAAPGRWKSSPGNFALEEFSSLVERGPSPIHGRGLFAKGAIRRGVYAGRDGDGVKRVLLEEMRAANSAAAPPWDVLLFGKGHERDSPKEERPARFREGFGRFAAEERAKATVAESVVRADGKPPEVRIDVVRDVAEGSEVLRAYGPQWLSIKYHHLKNVLLTCRKILREGGDERCWLFVDRKALLANVYTRTMKERGPHDTARDLTKRGGKTLHFTTREEAESLLNVLEVVAFENLGEGNELFDAALRNVLSEVKRHEQKLQDENWEPFLRGSRGEIVASS